MAKPNRGEVWLVDMGYAAKVRPALVISVPIEEDERVITTVVPHTTNARESWHQKGPPTFKPLFKKPGGSPGSIQSKLP